MNFFTWLKERSNQIKSLVSVGLDSDFEKIKGSVLEFNKKIITLTSNYTLTYKINTAFYEAAGLRGIEILKKTCDFIKKNYPFIPVIIDGKRADIGNTSLAYSKFIFDYLKADATTVNPYLGWDSLEPFFNRKDKGVFVLIKTSNPSASEFQNLLVLKKKEKSVQTHIPLYLFLAETVVYQWHRRNCGLVVGGTFPQELSQIRKVVGDSIWLLIPGIGTQGGVLEEVIANGLTSNNSGLIINSSRQIIFSQDPLGEIIKLRTKINNLKKKKNS